MTDTLCRQDIQGARIMIERFIIKIELGYDQVRFRYRYPLGAGLGSGSEKGMLESEPIERSLHDMDQKVSNRSISSPPTWQKNLCPQENQGRSIREIWRYTGCTQMRKRRSENCLYITGYQKSGSGVFVQR
jgi:hypothetical protein